MKARITTISILLVSIFCCTSVLSAQVTLRGTVADETGETLIGASVVVVGTTTGNTTDFDGNFELTVPGVPTKLVISYVGYSSDTILVESGNEPLNIVLGDNATTMVTVEVKGRRISEKRQQSALTMETLDNIAIKETPAANFYDGLGALKDVDLTAASLGFKIINTRGFNSTNPVRSLQIIDGVDNQSPGLNFSLGNFLGASDLDVNSVNIIVGASSAFYGPNAFNGVISMETKDPFLQQGLSATVKVGERQLVEGGFRWAQAVKNKEGKEFFAYKINAYGFQANDWVADNYDAVDSTDTGPTNPGGYDAVNIYGDEFDLQNDRSDVIGLGQFHRKGYTESELVDYNAENYKASVALHFRLKPELDLSSPTIIASSNYSTGTTIFQGDNRFSLRGIQFFQHKLELAKRGKYFLRSYITHEDAGDSYDPYFTALELQKAAQSDDVWSQTYQGVYQGLIVPRINSTYGDAVPSIIDFPNGDGTFNVEMFQNARRTFESTISDSLSFWHQEVSNIVDENLRNRPETEGRYVPGTARFDSAFNAITSRLSSEPGGTRFFDRSALGHIHGEYMFKDLVTDREKFTDLDLRVGANYRQYMPNSRGTILQDTAGRSINTYEYGVYGGGTATFYDKWKVSGSLRLDKNKNFDFLVSPAASVVYTPSETTTLRLSFSSAIRNPTLADQFLYYNVGRAILLGNLNGVDSLITIESFVDRLNSGNDEDLEYFNVAPIRPEKVKTVEVGVRTTLWEKLFLDATYYYSFYEDFIGFNFGVDTRFVLGLPRNTQAFRVAANAQDIVTTQGFSIGSNYYFGNYFAVNANYSWNVLNTNSDDPIIPAFNTPEHKFNLGWTARDIPVQLFGAEQRLGFNSNYKWVDGFIFEGSPQFTGFIPAYGLLDAQVNMKIDKIDTTIKLGASNILNNKVFQTYGGPRVGRLAYASILYEFRK
ncbi:MAG: TonB-dependent receptor [Saprospiraceae bacterium]